LYRIFEIAESDLGAPQRIEPGSGHRRALELHSIESQPVFFTHGDR
jgi:hypothetical protein